jgi:hypothetical protein
MKTKELAMIAELNGKGQIRTRPAWSIVSMQTNAEA